jgi:tRNA (uracil-5-)-methyltransferase TRM9
MNASTRQQLKNINRDFYVSVADEFDATRERAWPGWKQLLAYLALPEPVSVLDVGCGNGRLARFLSAEIPGELSYTGVDSSAKLLAHARRRLDTGSYEWICSDVLTELDKTVKSRLFSLITAFGVMHHVPSESLRQEFVNGLAELLSPGGYLVISLWQFERAESLRRKIVPWKHYNALVSEPVDEAQLEPNDYLLSWGKEQTAHRYCHSFTSSETEDFIARVPLNLEQAFSADGRTGDLNRYLVFRRSS